MTAFHGSQEDEMHWRLAAPQHGQDEYLDQDLRRRFAIRDYDPQWALQFESIKRDLEEDLTNAHTTYLRIEHIGSTSVPGLASKATTDPMSDCWHEAIIDICIVVARRDFCVDKLAEIQYTLRWGERQGGYFYIGDGGVQDRWSFKLQGVVPLRNLYVCAEDSIPLRSYITLREVLRKDEVLRLEYETVKRLLAVQHSDNVLKYCNLKRPTIRKIFLKGGWTDAEVDEAEAQAARDWPEYTIAEFCEMNEERALWGQDRADEAGK